MTDEAIIEKIRGGDANRFATLVDRYGERIFVLILHIVDDEAEAEDLAQEAFVKAYAALPTFRTDACFASWRYRIAYNQALQWRRKRRFRTLSLDDSCEDVPDGEVDSFLADGDEERVECLIEAIGRLPALERTIVELFYYENLGTREIAESLSITEGAVRTKLYRLRKRLYKFMQEKR